MVKPPAPTPAPAPSAANGDGGTFTGTGTLDTSGIAEKRMPLAAPAPTTLTREEVSVPPAITMHAIQHAECNRTIAALRAEVERYDQKDRQKTAEINVLVPENRALRARVSELERVIEEKTEEAREVRDAVLAVVLRARALAPNDPDLVWLDTCTAELRKSKAKEPKR